MISKEAQYFNSMNYDIKDLNLETIKKNPHVLFPNYSPELNQALKVLNDKELISKYRLNNNLNSDNEKKVEELEKEILQNKRPKYYSIYVRHSVTFATFIVSSLFILTLLTFLTIIGKADTSQLGGDYKLWLISLFVSGVLIISYVSYKKIINNNKQIYKNEIIKLQDSIDSNKRENILYANEYNEIMSCLIKGDDVITINTHLKYYYQTNIEKLQEKTFKLIDEMYTTEIKITNKIENLNSNFIILPHDNWIISDIMRSLEKKEYSDVEKSILSSINITL